MNSNSWRQRELVFLLFYAVIFYTIVIRCSLQLSHDHYDKLYGLRPGLISTRLNDASDAQWRNFRSNLPILTFVFDTFEKIDILSAVAEVALERAIYMPGVKSIVSYNATESTCQSDGKEIWIGGVCITTVKSKFHP